MTSIIESNGSIGTLPDLEDSFILHAVENKNRWRTNVECVLKRTDASGAQEYYYLANECRAESVSETIFPTHGPNKALHEYCVVSTSAGNTILRHGSVMHGMNPIVSRKKISRMRYQESSSQNVVACNRRPVRRLSFGDAFLQIDEGNHNRLYMDVEFSEGGYSYNLYTSCRYTNYPNPGMTDDRYLQPISGYVVCEFDDRFYVAYVACHVRQEGALSIEFICRDRISFLGTKLYSSWQPVVSFLDRILFSHFFVTDEFHLVKTVRGSCTFFVYD